MTMLSPCCPLSEEQLKARKGGPIRAVDGSALSVRSWFGQGRQLSLRGGVIYTTAPSLFAEKTADACIRTVT
jgi:hypothetical protein